MAPGSRPSPEDTQVGKEEISLTDEAEVKPYGATSRIALKIALTYWTSFNTACWAWFACWRAAMPVDCRTLYWVMLATVFPMSAF
jgi:hypothetical protein